MSKPAKPNQTPHGIKLDDVLAGYVPEAAKRIEAVGESVTKGNVINS